MSFGGALRIAMANQLRVHPQVVDDLKAAVEWHDARSAGLGNRFRLAVDSRFDEVEKSPKSFPLAFDDLDYRFARIKKFPYLILFRQKRKVVFVLGVFHTASNPEKWKARGSYLQ
jgi:hypothetical protein